MCLFIGGRSHACVTGFKSGDVDGPGKKPRAAISLKNQGGSPSRWPVASPKAVPSWCSSPGPLALRTLLWGLHTFVSSSGRVTLRGAVEAGQGVQPVSQPPEVAPDGQRQCRSLEGPGPAPSPLSVPSVPPPEARWLWLLRPHFRQALLVTCCGAGVGGRGCAVRAVSLRWALGSRSPPCSPAGALSIHPHVMCHVVDALFLPEAKAFVSAHPHPRTNGGGGGSLGTAPRPG